MSTGKQGRGRLSLGQEATGSALIDAAGADGAAGVTTSQEGGTRLIKKPLVIKAWPLPWRESYFERPSFGQRAFRGAWMKVKDLLLKKKIKQIQGCSVSAPTNLQFAPESGPMVWKKCVWDNCLR